MKSLNSAQFLGNVGNDPEIKTLPSGVKVANFSIATNETYKNKAGETVKNTYWHKLQAFGKIAEIVEKYVKKGSTLFVEGKHVPTTWESGEKKGINDDFRVTNIILIDSKFASSPEGQTQVEGSNDPTDDLPF